MARKPKKRRYEKLTPDKILTATLEIAQSRGWANVRMNHVAAYIDVSLVDLHRHYQDMTAIADSWFSHRDAKTDCISDNLVEILISS